jgi:hypothetical protein
MGVILKALQQLRNLLLNGGVGWIKIVLQQVIMFYLKDVSYFVSATIPTIKWLFVGMYQSGGIRKMPEISLSVYCGVCGSGVCGDTKVTYGRSGVDITVTCSTCEKKINESDQEIEELKDRIQELEEEIKNLG